MAGELRSWRVRQKEKGVRQHREGGGVEGYKEIRGRESTAEM